MAGSLGFTATDLTCIATAISEIARNIVSYAREGEVHMQVVRRGELQGVEIVAVDRGPGIADLEAAMRDGFSTIRSFGMGLPGARRLMDEFEIESTLGSGTRVVMRKWQTLS